MLDLLAAGKTPSEIMSEDYFPALTDADIRACIAYASQMIRDDWIAQRTYTPPEAICCDAHEIRGADRFDPLPSFNVREYVQRMVVS